MINCGHLYTPTQMLNYIVIFLFISLISLFAIFGLYKFGKYKFYNSNNQNSNTYQYV